MTEKPQAKAPGAPHAPTEPVQPKADSASELARKAAEELARGLSRRTMFGAGMLGLGALIAQACADNDFTSGSKSGGNNGNGKKGGKDGEDGDGKDGTEDTGKKRECRMVDGEKVCTGGKQGGGPAGDEAGDTTNGGGGTIGTNGEQCSENVDEGACKLDDQCNWTDDECKAKGGIGGTEGNAEGGSDTNNDTSSRGNLDSGGDTDECFANTTPDLNLDNIPKAEGDLIPTVKFYGKDESAMVALKFGDAEIVSIAICRADGKLLALHPITAADKGGGAGLRPIIVDNIRLTDSAKIRVLVTKGTKQFLADINKEYFRTYEGKTVVDLSSSGGFADKQSVAQFAESGGTFNTDPTMSYPGGLGDNPDVRNLHTVKTGSSWTPGDGVKGTVTDIMGNGISVGGSGLIEYQTFCTYVINGDTAYRTILRVG